MTLRKILEDDWAEYDDAKVRGQKDAAFFACTEEWEVLFLKKKIKKHCPLLSDSEILSAIGLCCQMIRSPHPRDKFVECVVKLLGVDND